MRASTKLRQLLATGRTIVGEGADPYSDQCRQTAVLVAQRCNLKENDWHFAFQSQGMSGGPWVGPTVEDTIAGLSSANHRDLIVQPVGFVCDHVEVLFDIDILFREFAEKRGMKLWRAGSLNDSALFITALADVAQHALANAATQTAGSQTAAR